MRDLRSVSIPRWGLNANSRPLRRSQHDPKRDRPLDRLNKALAAHGVRLHPTKGFRFGNAV